MAEFDHATELRRLKALRDARRGKAGYKANVEAIERVIAIYEAYMIPIEAK